MLTNVLKVKLGAGETVLGCFLRYSEPALVELLALNGFDFVVLDAEHGALEPCDVENLVRAAELRDITPMVRVTANLPHILLRFLDTGAQGVHVPWVTSRFDAEQSVRGVKYPPFGGRGLGAVRAAGYAIHTTLADYVASSNKSTLTVLQIETIAAIEALPDILAVEGVDVAFIGPSDLSQSCGFTGNIHHPVVEAAMERIAATVMKSNVALGVMVNSTEMAIEWQARGARYLTVTFESMLRSGITSFLHATRVRS